MGSKDIGIGKSEFVAKTQFLYNQIYLKLYRVLGKKLMILTCKRRARVVVVGFQILVLIKGKCSFYEKHHLFYLKKLFFSWQFVWLGIESLPQTLIF